MKSKELRESRNEQAKEGAEENPEPEHDGAANDVMSKIKKTPLTKD